MAEKSGETNPITRQVKASKTFDLLNPLRRLFFRNKSKWYYERLPIDEKSAFPKEHITITATIANLLKQKKEYDKTDTKTLINQIDEEIDQSIKLLEAETGLSERELSDLCAGAIGSYRDFMETKYEINLRHFNGLRICPATKKITEGLFGSKEDTGMLFIILLFLNTR